MYAFSLKPTMFRQETGGAGSLPSHYWTQTRGGPPRQEPFAQEKGLQEQVSNWKGEIRSASMPSCSSVYRDKARVYIYVEVDVPIHYATLLYKTLQTLKYMRMNCFVQNRRCWQFRFILLKTNYHTVYRWLKRLSEETKLGVMYTLKSFLRIPQQTLL